MRWLSVDPGKVAGWCLRTKYGVEEHGACNGSLVGAVDDVVLRCLGSIAGERMMVLEDQFQRVSGWKAVRTLIRRAEIWAVIAERIGVPVTRVPAATWQAHLHLRGQHDQRMSGLRALLKAQSYDVDAMTEDECCACGIDLWAYDMSRVRA
jgi:hypothetical protein